MIHEFLDLLSQTTLALESKNATMDAVLPAIDYILEQFEEFKQKHKHNPILAPIFNSGWAKMDKYYNLTNESPAYIAAIILNPNFKWKYIESNWEKEWIKDSKGLMEAFWQLYKPQGTPYQVDQVSKPAIPQTKNDFKLWM
jgi:hypothetical protein